MMGFATTKENTFDDLKQISVAESLWAIFPNQGAFPATLQETNAKIFTEWLPSSDYELVELPGITFVKKNGTLENVYSEIWAPVKKKASNKIG